MKILVVGGGGREHAIVWKISQSPKVKKIYCAPGNAGIEQLAECVPIDPLDINSLLSLVKKEEIDLTVVGPEAPLVQGIVDTFEWEGFRIFGPCKEAAMMEGSKVFAKNFMKEHGIPTAPFKVFDNPSDAKKYILESQDECFVVKADGLAAGKGVVVASSKEEALNAVSDIMEKKVFGTAGEKIVIEERLYGEEVSILSFVDGETIIPMVSSQDHKAVFDGDKGPNTGGMGAYSPAPVYTDDIHKKVLENILKPTVKGLKEKGIEYKGVLYAGLMITNEGPMVLEFNVRFGDPEAQPVLFRLNTDLVDVINAVIDKKLNEIQLCWSEHPSVCVVLASKGYPGKYEKGKVIMGLENNYGDDVFIFHAGTKRADGKIVTSGGRVLGITAMGENLREALDNAYSCIGKVRFENMHYRRDIGEKALRRLGLL